MFLRTYLDRTSLDLGPEQFVEIQLGAERQKKRGTHISIKRRLPNLPRAIFQWLSARKLAMSHVGQRGGKDDERAKPDAAALIEKGKRWFAEAREQTKRDDEDIAAWHQRRADRMDGIGGTYFTNSKKD